ncbi:MAG: 3-isopropylmalate dehydrogenase [Gemmatimonadaceae bacterium]
MPRRARRPERAAHIAVLPGDGIGPEVTAEAVQVLRAVGERFEHAFSLDEALVGGCAIDRTGNPLPPDTLALCRSADAVLLGAVGGPKWDDPSAPVRPEQGLLALRKALGLYANIRPVAPHPALADVSPLKPDRLQGVDLVVVRELTGGIYFGRKRKGARRGGGEYAADLCTYTTREVERVVRVAAALAARRRGRLTSVDKANVLETSRLWRRVTERVVRAEFPEVTLDHMLVDACAMRLVQSPASFDVIVTENMFGDILTDEASVLAGSMGLLPSASLGAPGRGARRRGLYEPIHGSAPDIAGKGVANPLGAILSVAMLLRHSLGLADEALAVERAASGVLHDGWATPDVHSKDRHRVTTRELGAEIADRVRRAG